MEGESSAATDEQTVTASANAPADLLDDSSIEASWSDLDGDEELLQLQLEESRTIGLAAAIEPKVTTTTTTLGPDGPNLTTSTSMLSTTSTAITGGTGDLSSHAAVLDDGPIWSCTKNRHYTHTENRHVNQNLTFGVLLTVAFAVGVGVGNLIAYNEYETEKLLMKNGNPDAGGVGVGSAGGFGSRDGHGGFCYVDKTRFPQKEKPVVKQDYQLAEILSVLNQLLNKLNELERQPRDAAVNNSTDGGHWNTHNMELRDVERTVDRFVKRFGEATTAIHVKVEQKQQQQLVQEVTSNEAATTTDGIPNHDHDTITTSAVLQSQDVDIIRDDKETERNSKDSIKLTKHSKKQKHGKIPKRDKTSQYVKKFEQKDAKRKGKEEKDRSRQARSYRETDEYDQPRPRGRRPHESGGKPTKNWKLDRPSKIAGVA